MPPQQLEPQVQQSAASSPHNSSTPFISENQRADLQEDAETKGTNGKDSKSLKQRILGLAGKNKENKGRQEMDSTSASTASGPAAGSGAESGRSVSPPKSQQPELKPRALQTPRSPSRLPYSPALAASPSRLRSSSPRLHSPTSSEIFERNVQEPIPISTLSNEITPAHIPSHVMTEDSIPPALEASAQVITSENLNPDEVEIVTSSSHQPAAVSVLEGSTSHADLTSLNSPLPLRHELSGDSDPTSSLHASGIIPSLEDDGASNYGQLDPTDVRRLSFISFKDVVNSEHHFQHQQHLNSAFGEIGSRDSLHIGSLDRAASPLRSPASTLSGGVTTPPPGINVNPLAASLEQSPVRIGSPGSAVVSGVIPVGDLNIETMRQSIRKTASGDLSAAGRSGGSDGGVRSVGMGSPVSESGGRQGRLRTNS